VPWGVVILIAIGALSLSIGFKWALDELQQALRKRRTICVTIVVLLVLGAALMALGIEILYGSSNPPSSPSYPPGCDASGCHFGSPS
jgi:hypothetical protein